MIAKFNPRLLMALAPGLALGSIAVLMADRVEPASTRFVLQFLAIGAVADMSWRVGAAALAGTITRAHGLPDRLRMVTSDHRRTTFDGETGLHVEWYFRLRLDEEIARAKRYGDCFSLIVVTSGSRHVLDAARITTRQWLRDVDYAGDLGNALALCLPRTDRTSAGSVLARLTDMVDGLNVSVAEYPDDGLTLSALLGDEDARQNGLRVVAAA